MRLAYAYPSKVFERRLGLEFAGLELDPLETIDALVQRLVDTYGTVVLDQLPRLLASGGAAVPRLGRDLDRWLAWIEQEFVPSEPALLSPGAMSNAPDRLDGFHSFNKCCRGSADTGRHETNLRTYSTDRRVFEYWSDGDWIAADRLMGLLNAKFRDHGSADGGPGPSTADHIGPLSLGFTHRPCFRLLSRSANAAKNNRMTRWDVDYLVDQERRGNAVISWHGKGLWDERKGSVTSDETALRLSKLLRDNQRTFLSLLGQLLDDGRFFFLGTLLNLHLADRRVGFINLRIDPDFTTVFDGITEGPRNTRYAGQQRARRLRIAFDSLRTYAVKDNRHLFVVDSPEILAEVNAALQALRASSKEILALDTALKRALLADVIDEEELRTLSSLFDTTREAPIALARASLERAMSLVGGQLASMWNNERYVRGPFELGDYGLD